MHLWFLHFLTYNDGKSDMSRFYALDYIVAHYTRNQGKLIFFRFGPSYDLCKLSGSVMLWEISQLSVID